MNTTPVDVKEFLSIIKKNIPATAHAIKRYVPHNFFGSLGKTVTHWNLKFGLRGTSRADILYQNQGTQEKPTKFEALWAIRLTVPVLLEFFLFQKFLS